MLFWDSWLEHDQYRGDGSCSLPCSRGRDHSHDAMKPVGLTVVLTRRVAHKGLSGTHRNETAARPAWHWVCVVLHKPLVPTEEPQLIVKEEAAGSSPSIPAITASVRPFSYLQTQQGTLTWTSFLFDSRNDEWIFFHARKPYNSLNDQNEVTLSADRVCMVQCTCTGGPFKAPQLKAASIKRDVRSSVLLFLLLFFHLK